MSELIMLSKMAGLYFQHSYCIQILNNINGIEPVNTVFDQYFFVLLHCV